MKLCPAELRKYMHKLGLAYALLKKKIKPGKTLNLIMVVYCFNFLYGFLYGFGAAVIN